MFTLKKILSKSKTPELPGPKTSETLGNDLIFTDLGMNYIRPARPCQQCGEPTKQTCNNQILLTSDLSAPGVIFSQFGAKWDWPASGRIP